MKKPKLDLEDKVEFKGQALMQSQSPSEFPPATVISDVLFGCPSYFSHAWASNLSGGRKSGGKKGVEQ